MIRDGAAMAEGLYPGQKLTQREYLQRFGYAAPPLARRARKVAPLPAEVNRGTWIVLCPCKIGGERNVPMGGGVVWKVNPLLWCPRCGNADVNGSWRPVKLPKDAPEIERLLALRPDRDNQNWMSDETVAELQQENAEHGLPDVIEGEVI